jgi:hypothetical protein
LIWLDVASQSEWRLAIQLGDAIRWGTAAFDDATLAPLFSGGPIPRVARRWEEVDEADDTVAGRVAAIHMVSADYRRAVSEAGPPGGVWEPAPGTGRLDRVESVASQEPRGRGEPNMFVMGWIVEVDAADPAI